jgi:hypothetical protein
MLPCSASWSRIGQLPILENILMAKLKMICPYSHQLCRECSVFRGRHYYLCFCKDYRGYLGKDAKENSSSKEGYKQKRMIEENKFGNETE